MKVIRAFVLSGWQRVLTWNDWLPAQLSASLGTCMAKDWITSRLCSCTGMEMPSDVFLLQELGDVRGLALGFHREDFVTIAGRESVAYIANPELSHRCAGVLIACDLNLG